MPPRSRAWTWFADAFLVFAFATVLLRPLYKAEYLDAWTGAIDGAKAVTLADAGHLPMVEAQEAFIAAVEGFLS